MGTNTQEAVLSAYITSVGKRTPREAAQDAAELCRLANSLNCLNEIACNSGLTERQERRKQNLQTRIKAVLERAGLVLNHFESDPRGYAVYLDLPDGSYKSFGGRECGYGNRFTHYLVSKEGLVIRVTVVGSVCGLFSGGFVGVTACCVDLIRQVVERQESQRIRFCCGLDERVWYS